MTNDDKLLRLFIHKGLSTFTEKRFRKGETTVDRFYSLTRNKGTTTLRKRGPLFRDFSRKKLT